MYTLFFSQPQKQQDDTVKVKERKTEGDEADIEDCEKEEVAAEAELVDEKKQFITETKNFIEKAAKRQFGGINSKGRKQEDEAKVVDKHDMEEDPVISDDEVGINVCAECVCTFTVFNDVMFI